MLQSKIIQFCDENRPNLELVKVYGNLRRFKQRFGFVKPIYDKLDSIQT